MPKVILTAFRLLPLHKVPPNNIQNLKSYKCISIPSKIINARGIEFLLASSKETGGESRLPEALWLKASSPWIQSTPNTYTPTHPFPNYVENGSTKLQKNKSSHQRVILEEQIFRLEVSVSDV